MNKMRLPLISDTLMSVSICFFIAFTCLRYYTKNIVISAICGGVFAFLCGVIAFLTIRGKLKKNYSLKSDEKKRNLLAMHLSLCVNDYILSCYEKILENSHRCQDTLEHFGEKHFFMFKMSGIDGDDVARLIKNETSLKKVLHCNYIDDEARNIAKSFGIQVLDIKDAYISFNEYDLMPEKFAYDKSEKRPFLVSVKSAFKRSLYKKFFFYGLGLLFLSYFTFFPVYYMVCGGGMLLLSLICLLFGSRE